MDYYTDGGLAGLFPFRVYSLMTLARILTRFHRSRELPVQYSICLSTSSPGRSSWFLFLREPQYHHCRRSLGPSIKNKRLRLRPFPLKQAMPFLTVDPIIDNQSFQNGRCHICFSSGLDKVKTGYNFLMEII